MKASLMRRLSHGLSYFWILLSAMPSAADPSRIWVLDMNAGPEGTIQIIDPATNKIVQTINGIGYPHGLTFSPDERSAYVASENQEDRTIFISWMWKRERFLKRVFSALRDTMGSAGRRGNIAAITQDGRQLLVCVGSVRLKSGLSKRTARPVLWTSWIRTL